MTVQATFQRDSIELVPGRPATLRLTITNLDSESGSVTITPAGLPASWCTVTPPTLTLLRGAHEQVELHVTAPQLASTAAGPTLLTVRVVCLDTPDDFAEATIVLDIAEVRDRRLLLLQPALRGRRTANYELMLENRGNTQASCRMRLVEPTNRLQAEFDPPSVGVEPGATALVRAKLHATKGQWERRERNIPIQFEAGEAGVTTTATTGTFVQAPMFPTRVFARLLALLAVAGLVTVGWFAVLRPQIRRAADDAVTKRLPAAVEAPTTSVDPSSTSQPEGPSTTVTGPSGAPPTTVAAPTVTTVTTANAGQALSKRLAVSVAPGQTDQATYDVPAGSVLRLTDVVLQNPNFDRGEATLARGEEVLLTWGIDNLPVFVSTPLVTPIELQPGDRLVFTVSCTGVGGGSTGTCTPALLVSGRLIPSG